MVHKEEVRCRINKDDILIYHNSVHEYKMIHAMLRKFFGPLSMIIMEYIGMMIDDEINVPTLSECGLKGIRLGTHKKTIVCSQYLFDPTATSTNTRTSIN